MSDIREYKLVGDTIVRNQGNGDITTRIPVDVVVMEMLAEGWEPIGGCAWDPINEQFVQAMIRRDDGVRYREEEIVEIEPPKPVSRCAWVDIDKL